MKKIVSILLSALLLIGCVAISATADVNVYTIDDVASIDNYVAGSWENGVFEEHERRIATNGYVAVDASKTYTLVGTNKNHSNLQFYLAEFDADKNLVAKIGRTVLGAGTYAYTPSTADVSYIALTFTIQNDAVKAVDTNGIFNRFINGGYSVSMVADGESGGETPEPESTTVTETTTTTTTTQTPGEVSGVAMIVETNTGYSSFGAALNAISDNQTIKLLADVSDSSTRNIKKVGVTLDLNEFTYTQTGSRAFDVNDNKSFTIKNGNIVVGIATPQVGIFVRDNASLALDSVNMSLASGCAFSDSNSQWGLIGLRDTTGTADLDITNCVLTSNGVVLDISSNMTYDVNISNSTLTGAMRNNSGVLRGFGENALGTITISESTLAHTDAPIYRVAASGKIAGASLGTVKVATGETIYNADGSIYVNDAVNADGTLNAAGLCTRKAIKISKAPEYVVENGMLFGASIRLNEKNGIRFYSDVDFDKVAQLEAAGYTVQLGTIIAPKDVVYSDAYQIYNDLTTEIDHVVVPFDTTKGLYEEGNFEGVVGSIVEIKEANYGRDFVGRGYATITKDGKSVTFYNDYYEGAVANNTRSLKFVSQAVIDDGSVSNYSEDQQQLINLWAAAADWSKPTAEAE